MFPGAKIGVLGLNGAGKSTLLRIIAGEDDATRAKCCVTPGFSVGFLPQEPRLDPDKDVLGNVIEGVAETKNLLDRFEASATPWGSPTPISTSCSRSSPTCRTRSTTSAAGTSTPARHRDGALRLPAADADVTKLSGGERRRVALSGSCSEADLLLLDEPTNTSTRSRWPGSSAI